VSGVLGKEEGNGKRVGHRVHKSTAVRSTSGSGKCKDPKSRRSRRDEGSTGTWDARVYGMTGREKL